MFPALLFVEPNYFEYALRKPTQTSPIGDISRDLGYELGHD